MFKYSMLLGLAGTLLLSVHAQEVSAQAIGSAGTAPTGPFVIDIGAPGCGDPTAPAFQCFIDIQPGSIGLADLDPNLEIVGGADAAAGANQAVITDGTIAAVDLEASLSNTITNTATQAATNAASITTNTAAITSNDADIAANAAAITSNDADIAANAAAIASNDADIAANVAAITSNDADIAANATASNTNATAIASNDTGIAANLSAINQNTADIAAISLDSNQIGANTSAIAALNSSFGSLNEDINDLRTGVAISLATAAPDFVAGETFSVRFSGGVYDGASAVGVSAAGVIARDVGMIKRVTADFGIGLGLSQTALGARGGIQLSW